MFNVSIKFQHISRFLYPPLIAFSGFLASSLLETKTDEFFTDKNLIIIIFFVLLGFTMFLSFQIRELFTDREKTIKKMDEIYNILGRNVRFEDYPIAYETLINWVKRAKNEVLILTYTGIGSKWTLDPESERLSSTERRKWFEILNQAIKSENIIVKRIVQIDLAYPANEASDEELEFGYEYLATEALNKAMSIELCHQHELNPSKSTLFFSRSYFPNTFVLVDGNKLFMNIEFIHPKTNKIQGDFVLLAEGTDDGSQEAFSHLKQMYNYIEGKSKLIHNTDKFNHY